MKQGAKIFVFCVLPLLAGALIYLFYRAHGIMSFSFRTVPGAHGGRLWALFTGSFPDFCWAYSFANALYFYLRKSRSFLFSTLVVVPLVSASELIQLWMPRYFTFDPADLAATFAAILLSIWYFKTHTT